MKTDFSCESRPSKESETELLNGEPAIQFSEANYSNTRRPPEHKRVIFEDYNPALERGLIVSDEMGTDVSFGKFQNNFNPGSLPGSKNKQINLQISQTNRETKGNNPSSADMRNSSTQSLSSVDNLSNLTDPRNQKIPLLATNQTHEDIHDSGSFTRDSSVSDKSKGNTLETLEVNKTKQPIIVMKIDLGSGRKDDLCLFEGDDPAKVALDFCLKNQLDSKVVDPLTRNIIVQIRNYQQYKEERTRQRSLSKGQTATLSNTENSVSKQLQTPKDCEESMSQGISARPSKETRSSYHSEGKAGADRARPIIKFELQNGKVLEDETPQPEKEVRRELFTDIEKQYFEAKFTSVHKENPKLESTPINKKEVRESLECQNKAKPGLIHNIYEQIQRPVLRNSIKSPQSNKILNKSLEKVIPGPSKSLTESKKRNDLSMSFVDSQKQEASRNYNIDTESRDDQYEKIANKFVSPTSRDASFNRLYQDANAKKNRLDQLSAKVKLERTLREEKENTFRPSINKPRDSQREKTGKLVVQSPTSKLKPRALLTEPDLTSPNNGSRGNLSVRNINSGSRSNLRSNSRQTQQMGSSNLKHNGSLIELISIKNNSKSFQGKPKELSVKTTQSFVTTGASSGNKILNRSSNVLKENRQANISFTQLKSPTNMNKKANETAHTDKKISLRESILNRTRSEKILEKRQTQLIEEKVVRHVFGILDGSRRGVITAETINITTIDSKILEIISDILFSLEDEECSLNFQQFHRRLIDQNLIERLLKLVPVDQEDEDDNTPKNIPPKDPYNKTKPPKTQQKIPYRNLNC